LHPFELVTVNVQLPEAKPGILIGVTDDENAKEEGEGGKTEFIVQLPAGRPVNLIVPVATVQVG
jgi:hypothetical protein